jgi:hypothetical protein
MSTPVELSLEQLSQAVCATLEQLAFAETVPCPPPDSAPSSDPMVAARLSFNGPLPGALTLRIPAALARELAGDALGDPDTAADAGALRDAVGEFLNTIAGTLLRDAGLSGYELGLPEPCGAPAAGAREAWFEVRDQKLAVSLE